MDQSGSATVQGRRAAASKPSSRYAAYALALLMLTFTMNFVDGRSSQP